MKNLVIALAALVSCFTLISTVSAAPILWGDPQVFTGPDDIITGGPLVVAVNQGGPAQFDDIDPFGNPFTADPIDVNTSSGVITFEARNDFPRAPFNSNGTSDNPIVDYGDAGFNEVINQAAWADSNFGGGPDVGGNESPWAINVYGLEVGTQYQIQFFVSDARFGAGTQNRTQTIDDLEGNSVTLKMDGGEQESVVGTFTADAGTQLFRFEGGVSPLGEPALATPHLNAYVLRQVPEASTFVLSVLGYLGAMILLVGNRRK